MLCRFVGGCEVGSCTLEALPVHEAASAKRCGGVGGWGDAVSEITRDDGIVKVR